MAGFFLFALFPALSMFFYSLTRFSGAPGSPLNFSWFHNYIVGFSSGFTDLRASLVTTAIYTVGVTVLQNAVGLGLALLFNRPGHTFAVYRALVFLPTVFSVVIIGVLFTLMTDPNSGLIAPILARLHLDIVPLGEEPWALLSVILISVWAFSGFTMLLYIAALQTVPRELYESSLIDGASSVRRFSSITWPLLSPAVTVNVFLSITGALGQFALILALTDGRYGTQVIGMYMWSQAFGGATTYSTNFGYASMLAVLQFGLTVVVGGLALVFLRRREVRILL